MPGRPRLREGVGFRGDNPVYKRTSKGTVKGADGKGIVDYVGRRGYDWFYSEKLGKVVKTAMLTGRSDEELKQKLREWVNAQRLAERNFAVRQSEQRALLKEIQTNLVSARKLSSDYELVNAEIELAEHELLNAERRYDRNTSVTMLCLFFLHAGSAVETTKRVYESYLNNHIAVPYRIGVRAIGDIPFEKLTPDDFAEWEIALTKNRRAYEGVCVKDLSDDQWSKWFDEPASRNLIEIDRSATQATAYKAGSFLLGVLNWAVRDRHSVVRNHVNPLSNYKREISKPRRAKARRASVRGNEFDLMIASAESLGFQFMVPLMALVRCGFRPAEARGLRWVDRLDEQRFKVAGRIVYERSKGQKWAPGTKTTSAEDEAEVVTLSQSTIKLLEAHRDGGAYVVPPVTGARYPWLGTQYTEYWHQIADHAGISFDERQTTYALKHGLISELLLANVAPHTIVLMTRHTTLEMVMRVYNDIGSLDLAKKVDEMDAARRAGAEN